jgi:hypothetical protein
MTLLMGVESGPSKAETVVKEKAAACRLECLATGVLQEIHITGSAVEWTGVTGAWVGIFADSAGVPGAVLGQVKFTGQPPTGTPFAVSGLSVPVTKASFYHLGFVTLGGTAQFLTTTAGSSTVRKSTSSTLKELAETAWNAPSGNGPMLIWGTGVEGIPTVLAGAAHMTMSAAAVARSATIVAGASSSVSTSGGALMAGARPQGRSAMHMDASSAFRAAAMARGGTSMRMRASAALRALRAPIYSRGVTKPRPAHRILALTPAKGLYPHKGLYPKGDVTIEPD